jgi:hypothetical protein
MKKCKHKKIYGSTGFDLTANGIRTFFKGGIFCAQCKKRLKTL